MSARKPSVEGTRTVVPTDSVSVAATGPSVWTPQDLAALGALVDVVARRAAGMVSAAPPTDDGWLNVEGAADYLAAPRSRIYDLVRQGRVRHGRDGSRLVFRRAWLDAVIEEGTP